MDAKDILIENQQRIIDNLQRELANTVSELFNLIDACNVINSTLDQQKLLKTIMELAARIARAEASSIFLHYEEDNTLRFQVAIGEKSDAVKDIRVPMGQGIAGWVALHGQPLLIPDVSKDRRFYKKVDEKSQFVTRSILCVPLKTKNKVIGVVQVLNKIGDGTFTPNDQRLLQALANQAAITIETSRLYQKTEEDRQRIETIVNSMGDAIIVTDHNFHISLVNNAAREIFGFGDGEASALSLVGKTKVQILLEEIRKLNKDTLLDIVLMKPERTILSNKTTFMRDEEGGFTGAILALRNVSELKERERRKLEFLALVAHSLAEPVGEIMASANGNGHKPAHATQLSAIHNLVKNLIYFAELESGPMRLTRFGVKLPDIVDAVVKDYQEPLAERRLEVARAYTLPDEEVRVDVERVKVVLRNVLELALKSAADGATIKIAIGPEPSNAGAVRFSMFAPGKEIPDDRLKQIFDRSHQAENFITIMGEDEVGLGLAFAKHIIDAHGGEIWGETVPGAGTEYHFTLLKG